MEKNGVFVQDQEELSSQVWDELIYKQKSKRIKKEMSLFLQGLK